MRTNTVTTIMLCALVAALHLSGCQKIEPAKKWQAAEAIVTYSDGVGGEMSVFPGDGPSQFANGVTVQAFHDGVVRVCVGRFRPSDTDSAFGAGYRSGWTAGRKENPRPATYDTVYARERPNLPESPNSSARVEKAMAAAGITLPEVVTYLNGHNLDVVDRGAWQRPHWAPSIVDAQHPRPTYYLFRPYVAVADTTVEFMVRGNISGAWPADVQGVYISPGGAAVKGPVSVLGWTDGGTGAGSLPGVGE